MNNNTFVANNTISENAKAAAKGKPVGGNKRFLNEGDKFTITGTTFAVETDKDGKPVVDATGTENANIVGLAGSRLIWLGSLINPQRCSRYAENYIPEGDVNNLARGIADQSATMEEFWTKFLEQVKDKPMIVRVARKAVTDPDGLVHMVPVKPRYAYMRGRDVLVGVTEVWFEDNHAWENQ